ncbi:MAG: G1 family glutamic endopeptidase [Terriglobales bacterium]|jgi:hypothetical protein
MTTKWFGILLALATLPLFAQSPDGATSLLTPDGRIPRQHPPRKVLPDMAPEWDAKNHVTVSYNLSWAGYAVTGSDFTAVNGSWTVTEPNCSKTPDTYSSEWVGIDGWDSDTVEQIGTDTDCTGKTPYFYVWYEFFPLNTVVISDVSIKAGDVFSASVIYEGSNEYTVSIKNDTTGQSFSKKVKFGGAVGSGTPKRNSAEWIMEMDSGGELALTDFGTDSFGQYYTGVSGGTDTAVDSAHSGPITDFGSAVQKSITTQNGESTSPKTSLPSNLAPDGSSFTVKWKSD